MARASPKWGGPESLAAAVIVAAAAVSTAEAAAVATAATAAVAVSVAAVTAAAEQNQQNDDPHAAIPTEAIVIHKRYLLKDFVERFHAAHSMLFTGRIFATVCDRKNAAPIRDGILR